LSIGEARPTDRLKGRERGSCWQRDRAKPSQRAAERRLMTTLAPLSASDRRADWDHHSRISCPSVRLSVWLSTPHTQLLLLLLLL